MKKRLLFVMPSMSSGGGERSLLTLLQLLDYDKYEVDLFLFSQGGLFFDMLPEQVNVLPFGIDYGAFRLAPQAILAKGRLGLLALRLRYTMALRKGGLTPLQLEQRAWKLLKKVFKNQNYDYDAAIAYLEGNPIYFVADCVKAKTKIGYIHSDYSKLGLEANADRAAVEKLNYFVGVSPECSRVLGEFFPEAKAKIRTIENITSPAAIAKMAQGDAPEYESTSCVKILTVGRLSPPKGYDTALDAAEKMAADGIDFKWFSIGTGELREQIEEKIKEKKLEEKFILLGERANPYPYISGCDIYVQPSHFEGKSIAIDEVKCLAKPIVATKFSTVFDQLTDGKTALLAQMNGADVAAKIENLINDASKQNELEQNLKNEKVGNEEELEKFYGMLGDI